MVPDEKATVKNMAAHRLKAQAWERVMLLLKSWVAMLASAVAGAASLQSA
jgi:hypothetical protein